MALNNGGPSPWGNPRPGGPWGTPPPGPAVLPPSVPTVPALLSITATLALLLLLFDGLLLWSLL